MGWGGGSGKKQVLDPASGGLRSASEDGSPFKDRFVLIDISGLAHRAAKQQPVTVAREGVSVQQQQYVRRYLESVVGEGGRPVVVLDGKAYPPKAATRATHRADQAQARASAEEAEAKQDARKAASEWKKAAVPQEPFWHWLLEELIGMKVPFIYSPYEADAQLVALQQELGEQAVIWAASEDSDLVAFGGAEVIYNWDINARTYRRVRLLDDVLRQRPVGSKYSFLGWPYDRFLVFTILSGNDYFPNVRGLGISKVYDAMAAATLPPHLVAPTPHPPLEERPAAWYTHEALRDHGTRLYGGVKKIKKIPIVYGYLPWG